MATHTYTSDPTTPATKHQLSDYLGDQQNLACRIEGLLDALLALQERQPERGRHGEYAITLMVYELARDLNRNLDITSLPEDGRAAA